MGSWAAGAAAGVGHGARQRVVDPRRGSPTRSARPSPATASSPGRCSPTTTCRSSPSGAASCSRRSTPATSPATSPSACSRSSWPPSRRRRAEADVNAAYHAHRPGALGALLDLTAHVLAALPGRAPRRRTPHGRLRPSARRPRPGVRLDDPGRLHGGRRRGQRGRAGVQPGRPGRIDLLGRSGAWQGTAGELLDRITPDHRPGTGPATPGASAASSSGSPPHCVPTASSSSAPARPAGSAGGSSRCARYRRWRPRRAVNSPQSTVRDRPSVRGGPDDQHQRPCAADGRGRSRTVARTATVRAPPQPLPAPIRAPTAPRTVAVGVSTSLTVNPSPATESHDRRSAPPCPRRRPAPSP